jgi:hypothetical protein
MWFARAILSIAHACILTRSVNRRHPLHPSVASIWRENKEAIELKVRSYGIEWLQRFDSFMDTVADLHGVRHAKIVHKEGWKSPPAFTVGHTG